MNWRPRETPTQLLPEAAEGMGGGDRKGRGGARKDRGGEGRRGAPGRTGGCLSDARIQPEREDAGEGGRTQDKAGGYSQSGRMQDKADSMAGHRSMETRVMLLLSLVSGPEMCVCMCWHRGQLVWIMISTT